MNTRPITEDDLHSFVDRVLDAKRLAEVQSYLDTHPDVLARVMRYSAQRELLRASLAPIADEPIPSRLNVSSMVRRQRRPLHLTRVSAVAASLALMIVGGVGGWAFRGAGISHRGIFALGREASDSYSVFAMDKVRPVEMQADQRVQLTSWVSQFLGRTLTIPDLTASGYNYMGGRVVATAEGPAVFLLYDSDKAPRLAMLVRPMADSKDTPMEAVSGKNIKGYAWATQGIGYSLVGAGAPDNLHTIADDARRQISGT